jgi:4-amino-4-deoxy-L-arabinose transferase-like glycosyltransferase
MPITDAHPGLWHSHLRVRPGVVEASMVAAIGCWALFQNLWRLGAANWYSDEPTYAHAGWRYVHGLFDVNLEHPFTAKYLIGLSQLLLGQNPTAIRLPAAVASLATGVLLWWWARQQAGRWAGLLCGGLWTLLPRTVDGGEWGPRIDRYAMLEPFLALFATLALYAGWRWARTGRWRWIICAGAAAALAATSKESGVVMAPVIALGGLLMLRSLRALTQLAAGAATAMITGLLTYTGTGSLEPLSTMVRFQSRHNAHGHLIAVAGRLVTKAPWWADLWFNQQAYGLVLSIVLVSAVGAAILLRRDALSAWVSAGAAAFLIFYCLVSNVALYFYYVAWQPEITLLAALGTVQVARRAGPAARRPAMLRVAAAGLAMTAIGCFAVAAVQTSFAIARLHPHGIARLAQVLERAQVSPQSTVVVTGFYFWEPGPYLSSDRIIGRVPKDLANVRAIAVHPSRPRSPLNRQVLALVTANQHRLRHVKVDEVDLYLATSPLHPPPAPPARTP